MEKTKAKTTHKRRTYRHHAPVKRRGRRRIGAIAVAKKKAESEITPKDLLLVVAGAAAGLVLDKVIPATVEAKMRAGIKVAGGFFLPKFSKDVETKKMLKLLGFGLAAEGGLELLQEMNILTGLGIAGLGSKVSAPLEDDDILVISLDGIDERVEPKRKKLGEYTEFEDVLNDNILNGDDIPVINDDINVIQDDILNEFAA